MPTRSGCPSGPSTLEPGLGVMAAGVPVFWWMRTDGARFRAEEQAPRPETRGGVREGLLNTEVIHGE